MSPTDFEAMSDSQYLVSLESQRRDETDFNEDVLVEYECEAEQEERDNKSSEDEQNSNGSISVQEIVWGGKGGEEGGEEAGERPAFKWSLLLNGLSVC